MIAKNLFISNLKIETRIIVKRTEKQREEIVKIAPVPIDILKTKGYFLAMLKVTAIPIPIKILKKGPA